MKIQGLLLNARMIQGAFDDRNSATVDNWAYPDTHRWDAERNTREFLAAMTEWRRQGLHAFTINLQGGSPQGYAQQQPWHNSTMEADGSLRPDYLSRLERILNRADELGMAVILGYFYFGQDQRLRDEAAVLRAVDEATRWVLDHGWQHVLIEINNECNVRYDHPVLQPPRVHELIQRVQRSHRDGRRLLVSTSYGGGTLPQENVVRTADFLLLHGNGVSEPAKLASLVRRTRAMPGYTPKPILFNEDDHFQFDQPTNNFTAALSEYASWGYFDFRMKGESFDDGYQSVPVNWGISSERKRGFFRLLSEITGANSAAPSGARSGLSVTRTNYHGWEGALLVGNAQAEIVIVPAVGRVMQFRFRGEEGVFWENPQLLGQPAPLRGDAFDVAAYRRTDWINFGGDKTWPAPEADWPKHTQRKSWRPPPAFDGMPAEARVEGTDVVLTTPTDPLIGLRASRRVQLDPQRAEMTIATTYERTASAPVKLGIWVITQLGHPVGVYAAVPEQSRFRPGYVRLGEQTPPSLRVENRLLSLTRAADRAYKIGTDADALLWVGERVMCRIESPALPYVEYPDQGSSAEVYTNPDPLPYVELELLGPLHAMKPGDKIDRTSIYKLLRRTGARPEAEARRLLGLSERP